MMKWNEALLWTRSVISSSGDRTINSVGAAGAGGTTGSGGLRSGAELTVDTTSRTENRDLEQGVPLQVVVQEKKSGGPESDKDKIEGTDVEITRVATADTEMLRVEQNEAGPSEQGENEASR